MKIFGRTFFDRAGSESGAPLAARQHRPTMDIRGTPDAGGPPALPGLLKAVAGWRENEPSAAEVLRSVMDFSRQVRSYSAAMVDEYNADFKGTFGSANTEIFPAKYAARARTRTLAKDTPQGKAVVRTYQNNVVGDEPFKLEMQFGTEDADGEFTENKAVNRAIERAWKKFCKKENFTTRKTMSFMEAFRVVEGSLVREGSNICRLYRDYPFNEFNFAVDFLEEDRLQEQFVGKSGSDGRYGSGNPIRGSIEYHPKFNFALAYWILTRHPGEFFALAQTGKPQLFREQVDAGDVILFSNLRERAEQDVGMTELDAAVQPIWRNHQFTKALTLCAIASHIRAFVLEKKWPTGMEMPQEQREAFQNAMLNVNQFAAGADGAMGAGGAGGDPAAAQQGGTPIQTLRPGQERSLPYGVEAKVLAPEFPSAESHDFRLDNHREVAIATGISYQHASGDFQNLGFIAGLMCQIPFQDQCKVRQRNLIDGGIDRIFREWLKSCILTGYFDRLNVDVSMSDLDDLVESAHFKGRGWAFVNPLVQAQALILLNEAGHLTRQQVQDQLPSGMSVEKLFAEFKNEKAEMEANGISLGADAQGLDPDGETPAGNAPKASGTEDDGPADVPPKSKKVARAERSEGGGGQGSGVRGLGSGRLRVPMTALLAMSVNGEH